MLNVMACIIMLSLFGLNAVLLSVVASLSLTAKRYNFTSPMTQDNNKLIVSDTIQTYLVQKIAQKLVINIDLSRIRYALRIEIRIIQTRNKQANLIDATTLSIMTPSKKGTQHNNTAIILSVIMLSAVFYLLLR
jgi:hypothetical protein